MSAVVRVVRQFHEGAETVTLSKLLVLPAVPTMGTKLDLRAEGVEDALTVVGVALRRSRLRQSPGPLAGRRQANKNKIST
jgi:hypothetical protein